MTRLAALLIIVMFFSGCQNSPNQAESFPALRAANIRSILVLPPTNATTEVMAPYTYLSSITRPIAEAGYYVFPVAVIDNFMKENGLADPYEMQQVPLTKLKAVFNPDAVMYINIEQFGQKFVVISSTTEVKATAKLIDTNTGTQLWQGVAYAAEGSGDAGGGLGGLVAAAVLEQVLDTVSDRVKDVAAQANYNLIRHSSRGLPPGPYRPIPAI